MVDCETCDKNYKVVQADELVQQLDVFNELCSRYILTEVYDKNRSKNYETIGLSGELGYFFDKKAIRFNDNNVLIQQKDSTSILKMLLLEVINEIRTYCDDYENKANIKILLNSGYINIDIFY